MPITLLCPRLTCRALLSVPDEVRGKRVRCASCGVTFVVPPVDPRSVQPRAVPAVQAKPNEST